MESSTPEQSSTPGPVEQIVPEVDAPTADALKADASEAVAAEPDTTPLETGSVVPGSVVPEPLEAGSVVPEPLEAGSVVPESVVPEPVPAPVTSLSLDEAPAAVPAVPDLDAVAARQPTEPSQEPVGFDFGGSGYAEKLAQSGYGQPGPAPADPYARIAPNDQLYGQPAATPPYGQQPSAPQPPYAQPAYQQPAAPTPYAQPAAPTPYGQPAATQQPNQQQPYVQQPYAQQSYTEQSYTEQQSYAQVVYQPDSASTLTPDQERTWASAAHWSALVASLVGLGFLGPLLVYLIQGPKSAWVKAQAAESLNFEITFIISMLASLVLMLVVVGFVTIVVFPVLWLVFRIIATVATAQGRDYRYPVNIRMVK